MNTSILNDEEPAPYGRKDRYDFIKTIDDLELAYRVRLMNSEKDETIFKKMIEELAKRFMNSLAR